MQDKTLLKISLAIAIPGILFLLVLASALPLQKIRINQISESFLDKKVQVQGKITSIKTYQDSNFQILTIADEKEVNSSIQVVYNPLPEMNLTKNQSILVTGKFQQYKTSLQIQADKIEVLNLK